jgi:hypothetical protein
LVPWSCGGGQALGQANAAVPQPASLENSIVELQKQVRELQSAVQEIHAEALSYRAETEALKKQLEAARNQAAAPADGQEPAGTREENAAAGAATADSSSKAGKRLAKVEEEQTLLTEKVDEQYQTKVESASKYRVRLSGIVLLNLFSNRGAVDNIDVPNFARARVPLDTGGSFGGTLRQSEIGLEAFGPEVAGARTRADVQFDFAGGFPNDSNGVTEGIVRLRTGTLRMDWEHTSVVAGQDGIFFSPLSPTSLASLSVPALAYAGNLWSWTPQLRVEHRVEIAEGSTVSLQAGLLDSLTGEAPPLEYLRQATAGERSGQPGYGSRVAWTYNAFGRPFTIGAGGYYSRQNWGPSRVNGWAGTADWSLPLTRRFSVTGEFYRGQAVAGLGGGLGRSVIFIGPTVSPVARGLDSLGGWTQLKFKATEKLEFNAAGGEENPLAHELRNFSLTQGYSGAFLDRNRSSFGNVIYRPRSDLLFSVEYRRLRSFAINGTSENANHINTSMGITF